MNNSVKKMENKIKSLHRARLVNPQMHWKILLRLFLSINILIIIFSLYFQYKISTKQIIIKNNSTVSPVLVNESALDKINNFFNTKKQQTKNLKDDFIIFKDPS